MPEKIVTEKGSKGKAQVSSGPGTGKSFKSSSKSDSESRPNKVWEKLPIISIGGEY